MGNSESSSQFPPPSNNNDGNNNKKASLWDQAKKALTEDDDEGSTSSALNIGAAVAGTALLAFGAYSLASSASSQSDDGDNSRRRATQMENLELEAVGSRSYQNPRNHRSYEGITSGRRHSGTPAAGGTNKHSALRMIKIMSYNVWSLEDEKFQIDKRMEAIGQLIEEHTPHIIFLQEMTHRIYGIFKSCEWWQLYECSDPPEKATIKHFCVQLSKLPVKKFFCESFDNSTTGRGLCVAAISTAEAKLIAATCHLKRPGDAHMHSEERMSQVKEALSILNAYPNVVFGGDMNWNESSDGQFPLDGEWKDAWSVLRPGEDGYTYDTESNPMLKHSGSPRGRLDRFIYKLKDFEVKRIEMIGTKAIPGISWFHNGQRLPILPSDHYGLILTICPST